jgi:raffinose/stachyose/melibiose transport system substrate-binding protein
MRLRIAALAALAVLAAACGATPGGGGAKKGTPAERRARVDVAKAGKVTLTVWDQEVRGGQNAQIQQLNSEFQAKYPNVTIKRVAKSFTDLKTTLKLAISGPNAPDVVEANQGRPDMGAMVKGGLLRPLDGYAKAYGWSGRWSKTLLDLNRFSADGNQFGSGNLYGVSQMGEIVGLFYNKSLVPNPPRTFAQFQQMVAAAKAKGEIPIAFGNLDKYGGIHEFQTVQNQFTPKQAVRDFVFAKPGASFDTPQNVQAATLIQQWARKGYFTPNFNGVGYDPAWQQGFDKGKGPFFIGGTWVVADMAKALGDKAGFMLMPGKTPDAPPVSLGGEGLPWSITSKSEHPDVAAAYLDFLTNANAARVLVRTNNLPAMPTDARPDSSLSKDVSAAWKKLNDAEGLVPYLDYSTPDFYDQITAAIQRLMAGKDAPQKFAQGLQSDYKQFTRTL